MAARRKVGDLRWHIPFRCLARPGEEAAHAGRRPGGNCRPPLLPVAHVPEHPLVATGRHEVPRHAIALRLARWVYANTQSRIHVLVTHGFLRSLARLQLEESAVGRFAGGQRRRPVNVGDTPWQGVAVLTLLGASLASYLRFRRAQRKKTGWRRLS